MQEKQGKKQEITLWDYYRNLTKKEKGQFIKCVMLTCGMSYSTIVIKLNQGRGQTFSKLEKEAVVNIINTGVWRT